MIRSILPTVTKVWPRQTFAKNTMNGLSVLTMSAAPLSSVSGEGSGNASSAKGESSGINPSKVVPVASDSITSGRVPPIVKKPLVMNSTGKPSNDSNCDEQTPLPKARSNKLVRKGEGSFLNFTSPASERTSGLAGVVTVDSKSGSDEEAMSSFTRFTKKIGGCSVGGLLAGGKQAYYSIAVLIGLLASNTKAAITVSSLNEGEDEETSPVIMSSDEVCALVKKELSTEGLRSEKSSTSESVMTEMEKVLELASMSSSSPKERLVETITSVLPVSRSLAEKIYDTWTMQNEGRANLFSIAAPSDYILDVKLIGFAELNPLALSSSSSSTASKIDATMEDNMSSPRNVASGEVHLSTCAKNPDPSLVELDSTHGSKNSSSGVSNIEPMAPRARDMFNRQISYSESSLDRRLEGSSTSAKGNIGLRARIKKLFSTPFSKRKEPVLGVSTALNSNRTIGEAELNASEKGIIISVNGNASSMIPSTALACVFLTLEAVVPPSRYTSDYDWYYNRVAGCESESERIMLARLLSHSSPKLFVSIFDFLNRMISGKQLNFIFPKSVYEKIGIPEDPSKFTPAMQKFMCLYLDSSKKWILSDLITLHPTHYKLAFDK